MVKILPYCLLHLGNRCLKQLNELTDFLSRSMGLCCLMTPCLVRTFRLLCQSHLNLEEISKTMCNTYVQNSGLIMLIGTPRFCENDL